MLSTNPDLKEYKKSERLMGNHFTLTVVSENEAWAHEKIELAIAEIKRIEKLLTTFSADSETNLINEQAGIKPIKISSEILELINRSLKISVVTDGAFDITYGSLDKALWNFDKTMKALPDKALAQQMVKLINYKNVILDEDACTVFLKNKGMRIGFGGIGKGYAAEQAKKVLKKEGVKSGIVNASGDLTVWGLQANGNKWQIGIADPDNSHLPFSALEITDISVATSGNYEKFVLIDGIKYSHTINPKTGLPVRGIKSVTIFCPDAEIADAMATPVTIMGTTAGLNLVNQLQQIECIIIDDNNKIYCSKNINLK